MSSQSPALYPLTFRPALRHYIWGGRNLEKLYGRPLPPGITAESWEISGHPTASTTVDSGPLRGQSLPEVLATFGEKLVGSRAGWALRRNKFPLLVKLLDAYERLSVQVHPGDEYALEHEHGELGKTEMWYVLHAQPAAQLILGLEVRVTQDILRRAVEDNDLEQWLHHVPVKAGEAVYVPAGTLHAILGGVVVAEIQQNSDTTYRVYDWGRMGEDGRPRPLHVAKALNVINFEHVRPGPYEPVTIVDQVGITRQEITRSEYFVVEKVGLASGAVYRGQTSGETLEIWGNVEGACQLTWTGEAVPLPTVRFCLVPAALGDFAVQAKQPATLLRVYLPQPVGSNSETSTANQPMAGTEPS